MDKLKRVRGRYGTPQNLKILRVLLTMAVLAVAAGPQVPVVVEVVPGSSMAGRRGRTKGAQEGPN